MMRLWVNFLDMISDKISLRDFFDSADSVFQTMSLVNGILPLDTILTCCGIYLSALCTWVVYKFIKSWIPTVSGS